MKCMLPVVCGATVSAWLQSFPPQSDPCIAAGEPPAGSKLADYQRHDSVSVTPNEH